MPVSSGVMYSSTMAFDQLLAERIRAVLADEMGVTEKNMFGGFAFMVHGNMAVGVSGDELMARVGSDSMDKMLELDGVKPFEKTGRRMNGWVLVEAPMIAEDRDLAAWIDRGLAIATALPPK